VYMITNEAKIIAQKPLHFLYLWVLKWPSSDTFSSLSVDINILRNCNIYIKKLESSPSLLVKNWKKCCFGRRGWPLRVRKFTLGFNGCNFICTNHFSMFKISNLFLTSTRDNDRLVKVVRQDRKRISYTGL